MNPPNFLPKKLGGLNFFEDLCILNQEQIRFTPPHAPVAQLDRAAPS